MASEFYDRYRHLNHRELYEMLMRGSPAQVDGLVAAWTTMETTLSGLAASLRADLDRLLLGWDSLAGREFDRRVGLISAHAQTLAQEFAAIHNGLAAMSGALAGAQRQAEHPDSPHEQHHERGGVIGGGMGHERDESETQKARQRMIHLICQLVADYRVTDFGTWPGGAPAPPPDLPTGSTGEPVEVPPPAPTRRRRHHHEHTPPIVAPGPAKDETPVPSRVDHSVGTAPAIVKVAETRNDNWLGTAPAVVGAIGAGVAVAGGVVAATRHRSRGHGRHGDSALTDTSDITAVEGGVIGPPDSTDLAVPDSTELAVPNADLAEPGLTPDASGDLTAAGSDELTAHGPAELTARAPNELDEHGPSQLAGGSGSSSGGSGASAGGTAGHGGVIGHGSDGGADGHGPGPGQPPPAAVNTGMGTTGPTGLATGGPASAVGAASTGAAAAPASAPGGGPAGPDARRWLNEGKVAWGGDGSGSAAVVGGAGLDAGIGEDAGAEAQ